MTIGRRMVGRTRQKEFMTIGRMGGRTRREFMTIGRMVGRTRREIMTIGRMVGRTRREFMMYDHRRDGWNDSKGVFE
jgi:hypothetical protein